MSVLLSTGWSCQGISKIFQNNLWYNYDLRAISTIQDSKNNLKKHIRTKFVFKVALEKSARTPTLFSNSCRSSLYKSKPTAILEGGQEADAEGETKPKSPEQAGETGEQVEQTGEQTEQTNEQKSEQTTVTEQTTVSEKSTKQTSETQKEADTAEGIGKDLRTLLPSFSFSQCLPCWIWSLKLLCLRL